jgi:hypothetical protein
MHHWFFYITNDLALPIFLQHGIFFLCNLWFFNFCVFVFFYRFLNFVIATTQTSCVKLCPIWMYTSFFLGGFICFVVCIHFNVNLFCFVEFVVHFQCVFLWCRCLCGYNHKHCLIKKHSFFFIYFFVLVQCLTVLLLVFLLVFFLMLTI